MIFLTYSRDESQFVMIQTSNKNGTVDGSEIPHNHLGCIKPVIMNNRMTYQPQLVDAGFLPSNNILRNHPMHAPWNHLQRCLVSPWPFKGARRVCICCYTLEMKSYPTYPVGYMYVYEMLLTPLKTNMFPENQWLEDVFPIEIVPFGGHVNFQGCKPSDFGTFSIWLMFHASQGLTVCRHQIIPTKKSQITKSVVVFWGQYILPRSF